MNQFNNVFWLCFDFSKAIFPDYFFFWVVIPYSQLIVSFTRLRKNKIIQKRQTNLSLSKLALEQTDVPAAKIRRAYALHETLTEKKLYLFSAFEWLLFV